MASIENRSRYVVEVRNRPDLTAAFPFNRTKKVEACVARLRAEGFKSRVAQRQDAIFVRIRVRPPPEEIVGAVSLGQCRRSAPA